MMTGIVTKRGGAIAITIIVVCALVIIGFIETLNGQAVNHDTLSFSHPINAATASRALASEGANGSKLNLFYATGDKFFIQKPDPTSQPMEVLSDPIFRNFVDFAWSVKANAFVMAGTDGIYMLDKNSPPLRLLLRTPDKDSFYQSPSLAPDGKHIAFIITESVNGQATNSLMVSILGGKSQRILGPYPVPSGGDLVNLDLHKATPQWSPDGAYIAFGAREGGLGDNPYSIFLISTACLDEQNKQCDSSKLDIKDSSGKRLSTVDADGLKHLENFGSPTWSPDGQQLAFTCNGGICTIDRDGTHLKRLTVKSTYSISNLTWSPDGAYLACVDGPEIYLFDLKKGIQTNLVHMPSTTMLTWINLPEASFLLALPTLAPKPTVTNGGSR